MRKRAARRNSKLKRPSRLTFISLIADRAKSPASRGGGALNYRLVDYVSGCRSGRVRPKNYRPEACGRPRKSVAPISRDGSRYRLKNVTGPDIFTFEFESCVKQSRRAKRHSIKGNRCHPASTACLGNVFTLSNVISVFFIENALYL